MKENNNTYSSKFLDERNNVIFDNDTALDDLAINWNKFILQNQTPLNTKYVKPTVDFFSMFGLSVAAQPFITPVSISAVNKSNEGISYRESAKSILKTDVGDLAQKGLNTLRRRVVSSLMPASFSNIIAEHFSLEAKEMTALNTAFETIIASTIFKEASEKFEQSFDKTKNYSSSEIAKREHIFKANYPYQSAALLMRNGVFSSATFMAKPWAKEIANNIVEEDNPELKENITTALTYSIRGSLACLTTPFEKMFIQFSSGQKEGMEVIKNTFKNVKSGNVSQLFAGGVARTLLCLMTSSTIAEAKPISDVIMRDSELFYRIMNDTLDVAKKHVTQSSQSATTSDSDVKLLVKDAKSVNKDDLKSSLEKSDITNYKISDSDIENAINNASKSYTQINTSTKTPPDTRVKEANVEAKKVTERTI